MPLFPRAIFAVLSLLSVAVVAFAPSARATVVVVPPLDEMAVVSEVIADVVIGEKRVVKEGGRVVTFTTLEVKDGWKGVKTGDVVELFQLGGDLDGKSSWIVGAQRFKEGERFVLFGMHFRRGETDRPTVIPYGIGFGVFKVDEQLTGEKVTEVVGDVVMLEKDPGGNVQTSNAPATRRYDTLAAFKNTVMKAVAGESLPKMNMNRSKLIPKQPAKPAPSAAPAPAKVQ
jgi:hypothetical protein